MLNARDVQDIQIGLTRLFEDHKLMPIDIDMAKTGEMATQQDVRVKDVYTVTLIVAHEPKIIEGEFKVVEKESEETAIIAPEETNEGTTDTTVP